MTVRGLDLDETAAQRIRYDNFAAFVGERKPVPESAFTDAVENLYVVLSEKPDMEPEKNWLEKLMRNALSSLTNRNNRVILCRTARFSFEYCIFDRLQ